MPKIIFYGPLGKKGKTIVGGSETGNQRTISILEKNGYQVTKIRKPYHLARNFFGEIHYFIVLSLNHLLFPFKILIVRGKKIIHLTGYYFNLIYFEWFMIYISKLLGCKTVYELRAGGLSDSIENGSKLYKIFLKSTLENSNRILTQGFDDLEILKNLTKTPVYYYPNYIKDDMIQDNDIKERSNSNTIEIIYFGRLAPSKNILFMLEVADELNKRGTQFRLELIGNIDKKYSKADNLNYMDLLKQSVAEKRLSGLIKITPPLNQKELLMILRTKHFFIFPSSEKREGHSNSLTEAMSCGLVPVASNSGFNRTVIGKDDLIILDYNRIVYADKILTIWKSGKWGMYSDLMYKRVKTNYTESVVTKTLLKVYE